METLAAMQASGASVPCASSAWEEEEDIMRPRLTPDEREARRKARAAFSFSDQAYRHYDPEKEGFGGPDEWEKIAHKIFGLAKLKTGPINKWLAVLGLDTMPLNLVALKKAFRAAMLKAHPDLGGSNAAARAVMEAFETLKHRYQ
jgi:hypothetical protein